MKYIDAEKLIAEIEKRMSENLELAKTADCFGHRAVEDNDTLSLIESLLQQEQPECVYGRTLEERKKYCKFCSAICKTRIEQEQPEVDLEKEYKEWWENKVSGNVNIQHTAEWYMHETARHFYELGLNAKKEE